MPEFLGHQTQLAELHTHLGGSVDPAVLWEIAHAQGIKLPTKDYWKFVEIVTVNPRKVKSFEDYLELFHWTEVIQSSPLAIEASVYHTVAGAYRKNNITLLELRFNPMKRNRGGERDLDQIMMAASRGLDRVTAEYPVRAGIIVCLDRTFDKALNGILVDKAIKYMNRGVVGIDIAGPAHKGFRYADCKAMYKRARKEGLG
ncbi:MAG: adenosine deaminase, partial [Nitrososphaerales archaeon]